MNIIITANSPGELYGWLRPLVKRLKQDESCHVILVLLPCAFSTGEERTVAIEKLHIDSVVSVRESLNFLFLRRPVEILHKYPPHILIHLGGDLFYAAALARKFNIPAIAYKWANRLFDRYFTKYFVPHIKFKDKILKQGIGEDKVEVTGELVADSVFDELAEGSPPEIRGKPVICFMAGNRIKEMICLIPFFMKIMEMVAEELPSSAFILSLSHFISEDVFRKILTFPVPRGFSGSTSRPVMENGRRYLKTDKGIKALLHIGGGCHAINSSDLLVSLPGTKTLEAAVMGKPLLLILPFNRPDLATFHGPVGLLDLIPYAGPLIKGQILLRIIHKMGHLALPNILAEREVVPELKDYLTPERVSGKILDLLGDRDLLDNMSKELSDLCSSMGGAADRVVDLIKKCHAVAR